jgi:hypothetical protein
MQILIDIFHRFVKKKAAPEIKLLLPATEIINEVESDSV